MKAAPIVLDMAAIYQGLIITLASALVVYFARQISKTVSEKFEQARKQDEETRRTLKVVQKSLRVDITEKFERFSDFYINTDQITNSEYTQLQELYTAGAEVGMNHDSLSRLKRCEALPRVPVRTKFNPYYTNRASE